MRISTANVFAVVAAFRRDSLRSTEAGLKYFVLGALSSGLLLYGASLSYGFAGTTTYAGILDAVRATEHLPLGLLFGLVFNLLNFENGLGVISLSAYWQSVIRGAFLLVVILLQVRLARPAAKA